MRVRLLASMLLAAAFASAPAALADSGPALTIDAAAAHHSISPLIYGVNFVQSNGGTQFAKDIDLPVDRRGGNRADTLNWQTGVENTGNDYYFENLPWCWDSAFSYCSPQPPDADAHRAYTDQIDLDRSLHANTLLDLPMLGFVPKAPAKYSHPFDCSFPATVFPHQQSTDQYDMNCGNGKSDQNGAWVTSDPQTDDATAVDASFEGAWVDDLVGRYGTAANGGVQFYELGNEPALWSDTHHDWHPAPVTYDELWTKSRALAAQVKQHDPSAKVLGFSEWGWPNYECSGADTAALGYCAANAPDRSAHGGTPLVEWLLGQFAADEQANGTRLLDYLDLHYYAQGGDSTDITRSLWDPTYTDPSWINDQIQLLPRMRKWIADSYPGTKMSLSEYDLARGPDATTDILIQADTLGIFGREGLDLATLWPEKSMDHYEDAFRVFRNFDGAHSEFGDTSVSAQSADQSKLAVYGALRTSDGALTLVVINKSALDLTSGLSLAGFTPGASAKAFRWTGGGSGLAALADQPVSSSGFTAAYPARSITVFAIPLAGSPLQVGTGGSPGGTSGGGGGNSPAATVCVVPKLKGLTLKKARRKLVRAHCRLGKVRKAHSTRRRGTVIAQKPRPGKRLAAGAKVGVVLSRGR